MGRLRGFRERGKRVSETDVMAAGTSEVRDGIFISSPSELTCCLKVLEVFRLAIGLVLLVQEINRTHGQNKIQDPIRTIGHASPSTHQAAECCLYLFSSRTSIRDEI